MKFTQVAHRLYNKVRRINFSAVNTPLRRKATENWLVVAISDNRMTGPDSIKLLNLERNISESTIWNLPSEEKLWLYNLHYFEDLVSAGYREKDVWLSSLVDRWIVENPPPYGNGWEPYPLSLRIVNWIKWFLNGKLTQNSHWLDSLALQTNVLSQCLERHLLGNHLLANAKALIFAGTFFDCEPSSRWLETGLKIFDKELGEQILEDGANFELSPMYHSLVFQDLLDLVNLASCYPIPELAGRVQHWRMIAGKMLSFMGAMTHPDGGISFFNDAAIGISPSPYFLQRYAEQLEVTAEDKSIGTNVDHILVKHFLNSGYLRVESGDAVSIIDCAEVGPSYLPGHAHADTLSFETSLGGSRLFVNTGTACYGVSDERLRQRGTAAHNTVVVDGLNSSVVWSGFRVANRAHPSQPTVEVSRDEPKDVSVICSHDGYSRLSRKLVHTRTWTFRPYSIEIQDFLSGGYKSGVAHYHIHPSIVVDTDSEDVVLTVPNGSRARVSVTGGRWSLAPYEWCPEFGVKIPSQKIIIFFEQPKVVFRLEFL